MKRLLMMSLILLMFLPLPARQKPDWVKERPIENEYYIGIGSARKEKGSNDHIQLAKDDALKNLASEIEITISSEVVSSVIEKSGILEDELRARIVSTTQAELEDYKLVDTWEDKKTYWIYYRLARDTYKLNRMKKIEKATALSLDLYEKAKESRSEGDITKSMTFYLQALKPSESYLTEPLLVEYEGMEIYLSNQIYAELQELVTSLSINSPGFKIDAKVGKPLKDKNAYFSCSFNAVGSEIPVSNMPIKFEFLKGGGDLVKNGRTGSLGEPCKLTISKITSTEKMQIVKATINIDALVEADSNSFIYSNIINTLPLPDENMILVISGITIFVEANELNLGTEEKIKHAEPLLKEKLAELGYSFTEDISSADIHIQLDASTTEGSFMYEMYSVFADANLSVTDMSSGQEIYKTSLSKVKGIDLDQIKAGRKALDKVGRDLAEEVVPELKKKL